MATVTTSIGTRSAENVDITGVSGAGPYTVTVDSVPSNTKVGDTLNDEAATPNSYLITGISGSDLTVTDSFGAGAAPDDSGSSQATTERTYAGATTAFGSWEADLDDTDLYAASDDAKGQVYNDGGTAFDESVTIDGGGTVGLNSYTLTVPESERHDGTAGTGARIVRSASSTVLTLESPTGTIEWMEITNTGGSTRGIQLDDGASGNNMATARNNIIHGMPLGIEKGGNTGATIINNLLYDAPDLNDSFDRSMIESDAAFFTASYVQNNTVFSGTNSGSGTQFGIGNDGGNMDDSDVSIQNNISMDFDTDFRSFSNATVSHNLSSDATASGTGSLTNKASADQFESTSPVDLHLKSGADAIDAGTDLGVTPTGVNIDIDGRDRDAQGDTWDMGADEFVAAAPGANPKGVFGHPLHGPFAGPVYA